MPVKIKKITDKDYLDLINREPTSEMVKEALDKEGKLIYKYIPKSVLQKEILSVYMGNSKFEIIKENFSATGIWGTGLLHYKHPVSGEWLYVSGSAFLPNTYEMKLNYPKLSAHIFINACKQVGVWFGQTLNKDDDAVFEEGLPTIQLDSPKKKMDIITRKKYNNALAEGDNKTIEEIKNNYDLKY